LKEEKEEKNSSSIVHHQSVKGIHGSVKKYTGRYCEHCFAEFQGKSATTYLIRHIHSSHQNVFRNSQKQYLPIAIKIASPVVQRGLDEMKSQTTGLQDYEIILNPRLAEILKISGFNSVSPLATQKKKIEMKIIQKVHDGDYVAVKLSDKLNAFLIGRRKITRFYSYEFQKNLYILLNEGK
jgi:hypothetical protein